MCRVMLVGGACGSYPLKNSHENQVLGHDSLAFDDAFVFNLLAGYVKQVTTTQSLLYYIHLH